MDFALNNLQRLICHKTQQTKPNQTKPTISFQTFFIWAFKIVVDYWKFSFLLLYILWDDWPIFMISGSNEHLQQEFDYTLLKPDLTSGDFQKCNLPLKKNDMQ